VTPEQAQLALEDFVRHRLDRFGARQDAMWTGEPFLYHSLLSTALNLKLLDPRDCLEAALAAWQEDAAPLSAVEGFIRQILGWREFVRGVYWLLMPEYADRNSLAADRPLPSLFWDADTDMNCLRQAVGQTLEHGYAHHIQRLMITGNFALLAGLHPKEVCDWYLAVYVDAVEWVELPNTLGMALHGDGGVIGTKPYAASANYIRRMSNYCRDCRYRADRRTGVDACPFNFLYWDFLDRHRERLEGNHRMGLALKNLERIPHDELEALRSTAARFRDGLD
jgi:deoxyribodipyrimidine photolyase-related protein